MNIKTCFNQSAINEIMMDLLTEDQVDQVTEFVGNSIKNAIKNNAKPTDIVDEMRHNLSYNQLLFLSTMYISNEIVNTIEEFENFANKRLKDL
jgi:hypothetical protein